MTPTYRCPICGTAGVHLDHCDRCGTVFNKLPCCVRGDGECGRVRSLPDGRTMTGHRYELMQARLQWEQRQQFETPVVR